MVRLSVLSRHLQPVQLKQGDWVHYIGADPKLQQDYGNQNLQIRAIDFISGIAVCDNQMGQCLVGVALHELQMLG